MNNTYFFGDSFTYGSGCRPDSDFSEYIEYSPIKDNLRWTEIVSNYFNSNEINYGEPGVSNEWILKKLLENLPKVKQDDLVVLGITQPHRTFFQLNEKHGYFTGGMAKKTYREIEKIYKSYLDSSYTDSFHQSLQKYTANVKLEHSKEWDWYFFTIFDKILKKLNLNYILWDYKVNYNFDNIKMDTKGAIKDTHWSWNGHKQFSHYLIERLENEVFSK